MSSCDYCGEKLVLFSIVKGRLEYCSKECLMKSASHAKTYNQLTILQFIADKRDKPRCKKWNRRR